jgi:hypothetical protein
MSCTLINQNPKKICLNTGNILLARAEGLGTYEPYPNLKEKLALFGQFVGDWDIVDARYPQPDGTEVKRKGEVHFGWILARAFMFGEPYLVLFIDRSLLSQFEILSPIDRWVV